MVHLIRPLDENNNPENPVVFLAGPIQGAADWQTKAAEFLAKGDIQDLTIACPRTEGPWHGRYNEQVDWETKYLAAAGRRGCILFWLAKENEHTCKRAYGQTTRFELGEWFGRVAAYTVSTSANVVVGIEDGFTNARYIRRRLYTDRFARIGVFESLEETCEQARYLIELDGSEFE